MPAKHSNMSPLDFERVGVRKRFRDLARDLEIGRQFIGDETLGQGNQPARIAHDHRLPGWRSSPEIIEHGLDFREPPARAGWALVLSSGVWDGVPEAHAQKLEPPEYIQVEQRVRVVRSAITARPARLLPAIEGANHHFRRMDQVVMQALNRTRSESSGPMRLFQLVPEAALVGGDFSASKKTTLEIAGQKRVVLQVPGRLALGVQNGLYALDDIFTVRQKEPQQLNVGLKRHWTQGPSSHDASRDEVASIRERV